MTAIFLTPDWFFGYDVFLEALFAIVTLLVAIYSFKVYKLTDQRQPKLFGYGFMFISLAYILKSFINYAALSQLSTHICRALNIEKVVTFNSTGIFLYMLFFIIGIVTLTYISLKIKDKKIYLLLLITTIIALIYSVAISYTFHILVSILLIIIIIHYSSICKKRKRMNNLLVLLAFYFLLFSNLQFLFSVTTALFYALGHFLELIGYLLILTNLLLLIKK